MCAGEDRRWKVEMLMTKRLFYLNEGLTSAHTCMYEAPCTAGRPTVRTHTVTVSHSGCFIVLLTYCILPLSSFHNCLPPLHSRKQDTANFQLLFLSLPSGSRYVRSTLFVCLCVCEHVCCVGTIDLLTPPWLLLSHVQQANCLYH